jgi:hypothetical protein
MSWQLGQSLRSLSPEQRAERYREFADAAFLKAQHTKHQEHRAEYLSMAAAWHTMAMEIEQIVGNAPGRPLAGPAPRKDPH